MFRDEKIFRVFIVYKGLLEERYYNMYGKIENEKVVE